MRGLLAFDPLCPRQHSSGSFSGSDPGHWEKVLENQNTANMIKTQVYLCQKDNIFKGGTLAHLPTPSLSLDLYTQEVNSSQFYFPTGTRETSRNEGC